MPFDDPMSLYEDSPQREWKWLRGIWAGRARADSQWWRLYFVVMVDDSPIGMQDLIGVNFAVLGTVSHVFMASAVIPAARPRNRDARGDTPPRVRGAERP